MAVWQRGGRAAARQRRKRGARLLPAPLGRQALGLADLRARAFAGSDMRSATAIKTAVLELPADVQQTCMVASNLPHPMQRMRSSRGTSRKRASSKTSGRPAAAAPPLHQAARQGSASSSAPHAEPDAAHHLGSCAGSARLFQDMDRCAAGWSPHTLTYSHIWRTHVSDYIAAPLTGPSSARAGRPRTGPHAAPGRGRTGLVGRRGRPAVHQRLRGRRRRRGSGLRGGQAAQRALLQAGQQQLVARGLQEGRQVARRRLPPCAVTAPWPGHGRCRTRRSLCALRACGEVAAHRTPSASVLWRQRSAPMVCSVQRRL